MLKFLIVEEGEVIDCVCKWVPESCLEDGQKQSPKAVL